MKEEYSGINDSIVQIKHDFDREKKRRTHLGDKVNALIFPSKKQHVVKYMPTLT